LHKRPASVASRCAASTSASLVFLPLKPSPLTHVSDTPATGLSPGFCVGGFLLPSPCLLLPLSIESVAFRGAVFFATCTQVRLLPENFLIHNPKYFVLCPGESFCVHARLSSVRTIRTCLHITTRMQSASSYSAQLRPFAWWRVDIGLDASG